MKFTDLKKKRNKQWANNRAVKRGWDRYRSTTFLETGGAKVDRALQCIEMYRSAKSTEEKAALEYDAMDSLKDALNYLGECFNRSDKSIKFLMDDRMP